MFYSKHGHLYQLRAPGYLIRANSKEACFDALMLCMINKVPANSFSPTVVTVDDAKTAFNETDQRFIEPNPDVRLIETLGVRVKFLADELVTHANQIDPRSRHIADTRR